MGNEQKIKPLKEFFTANPDYGYRLVRIFPLEGDKKLQIKECLSFVFQKKIDEIYCSMSDLTEIEMTDIISFADNNLKTLKFIPDEKQILSAIKNRIIKYNWEIFYRKNVLINLSNEFLILFFPHL